MNETDSIVNQLLDNASKASSGNLKEITNNSRDLWNQARTLGVEYEVAKKIDNHFNEIAFQFELQTIQQQPTSGR